MVRYPRYDIDISQGYINRLNFGDAQEFCTTVGGTLAAARSDIEQREVVRIANNIVYGMKFWISGNSLAPTGIWNWGYPFFETVSFYNFDKNPKSIIHTIPGGGNSDIADWQGMALLNGHRGGYSWKATPVNGTGSTHIYGFVCRKNACLPDQDVIKGLCSANAVINVTDSTASSSWIAIVIIIGICLFIGLFSAFMWHFYEEHAITIQSYFGCCKAKTSEVTPHEINSMPGGKTTRRKTIADLLVQHPLVPADNPGLEAGVSGRKRSSASSGYERFPAQPSEQTGSVGHLQVPPQPLVATESSAISQQPNGTTAEISGTLPILMNPLVGANVRSAEGGIQMSGMAGERGRTPTRSATHRLSLAGPSTWIAPPSPRKGGPGILPRNHTPKTPTGMKIGGSTTKPSGQGGGPGGGARFRGPPMQKPGMKDPFFTPGMKGPFSPPGMKDPFSPVAGMKDPFSMA